MVTNSEIETTRIFTCIAFKHAFMMLRADGASGADISLQNLFH